MNRTSYTYLIDFLSKYAQIVKSFNFDPRLINFTTYCIRLLGFLKCLFVTWWLKHIYRLWCTGRGVVYCHIECVGCTQHHGMNICCIIHTHLTLCVATITYNCNCVNIYIYQQWLQISVTSTWCARHNVVNTRKITWS